jgi:hypothetical protein
MTTTAKPEAASVAPVTTAPPEPSGATPAGRPKPDVRYVALRNFALSISAFNVLGYTVLGFEQPWLWPILAVLVAYTTELLLETISAWAQRREARYRGRGARGVYEFLLPAHITALACNMLLYANSSFGPVAFAVLVGVGAKYALQAPIAGRMRHFMNPSNLGITVTLLCFSSWVSIAPPYEFTENVNAYIRILIPLVIATAGTVINGVLTKRIPLIAGWVGGFVIQALLRWSIWGAPIWPALGVITGVAFVLFTNYMITDPGTTPMKPRAQFLFGASVAVVYGILMLCNVVYTLFFAVTIVCAIRGAGWWVVWWRGARGRAAAAR